MNAHDKRRKDALINSIKKAKECAETALLYLTANDRDPEDIAKVALAAEHIEIAMEHLGVGINE